MSVPRIYSRIVEGVKQKFSAESGIKRCIIDSAIDSKLKSAHSDGEYTSGFYDSVVFDKVRESLGGNVRIMASGGAPLTP
jgi:long-chain acyl-CoA synthetase